MKRFLTLFKIEGKLALRCPDGIIFGVIMPVGILFLIGFPPIWCTSPQILKGRIKMNWNCM